MRGFGHIALCLLDGLAYQSGFDVFERAAVAGRRARAAVQVAGFVRTLHGQCLQAQTRPQGNFQSRVATAGGIKEHLTTDPKDVAHMHCHRSRSARVVRVRLNRCGQLGHHLPGDRVGGRDPAVGVQTDHAVGVSAQPIARPVQPHHQGVWLRQNQRVFNVAGGLGDQVLEFGALHGVNAG